MQRGLVIFIMCVGDFLEVSNQTLVTHTLGSQALFARLSLK